jgi:hypothetical protein
VPLTPTQKENLFAALLERGWTWREDFIFAPHESIWLAKERPWEHDLADFRERMEARLARIAAARLDDEALSDTSQLVAALAALAAIRA